MLSKKDTSNGDTLLPIFIVKDLSLQSVSKPGSTKKSAYSTAAAC